jgi:hypothetical protein
MTIGFVGIWLFSVLDRSARALRRTAPGFLAQQVRSETGIGASGASGHYSESRPNSRTVMSSRPSTVRREKSSAPNEPRGVGRNPNSL